MGIQQLASRIARLCADRKEFVLAGFALITAMLAIPFQFGAPDEMASDEPEGPVFEAREDAIETRFGGGVVDYDFIVESPDGNLLDREGLTAVSDRLEQLRGDSDIGPVLVRQSDDHFGTRAGAFTIADRVVGMLGEQAGQAGDDAWQEAASQIIDQAGPVASGLSTEAERDPETGIWTSPALVFSVRADADGVHELGAGNGRTETETTEQVGREIQEVLRSGDSFNVWGIAIDQDLTASEQGEAAGPFIGLTVLAIVLMVGVAFRSYWALSVTGLGLIALLIWLTGLANLLGMKEDQILSTVVPIAMLAFGVDYAFHSLGRYREERDRGTSPRKSYRVGVGGVGAALGLALVTGAAAFIANTSSGIESIVQFGVTAAVGLAAAFLLLGYAVPLLISAIDQRVSKAEIRSSRVLSIVGGLVAAIFAMVTVLLLVFIAPAAGLALTIVYSLLFIGLPYALAGRFKTGNLESDISIDNTDEHPATPGRLERAIGALVVASAARRRIVLPVIAGITLLTGYFAVQVPASFDVEDFFAQDTDFVTGLEKVDQHIGDQGGETAEVFIEADLSDPAALEAIIDFRQRVSALDTELLARSDDGSVRVDGGILEFINVANANGEANLLQHPGNLDAVLTEATKNGVSGASGEPIMTGVDVAQLGAPASHGMMATRMQVHLVGSREQENIADARDTLEPLVADLESELAAVSPDATATLTGAPIVRQARMDAVSDALQVSLPIALVLCVVLAAAFMRSIRYALISSGAIVLVAAWLYGFMYLTGYSVNLVTATIGAISIGIGIDFATHFTMRYREELTETTDQIQALYRTGTGTGAALAGSTISSVVGFVILAFAPMPMFASFGILTAVMIVFALLASLVVLPGLLLIGNRQGNSPVDCR